MFSSVGNNHVDDFNTYLKLVKARKLSAHVTALSRCWDWSNKKFKELVTTFYVAIITAVVFFLVISQRIILTILNPELPMMSRVFTRPSLFFQSYKRNRHVLKNNGKEHEPESYHFSYTSLKLILYKNKHFYSPHYLPIY